MTKEWQKLNKQKPSIKTVKPKGRSTYLNADGALFFTDTDELVPGSTWDYPGSPYRRDFYDYDD